ncbi:MAG: pyridoxamine 5'-phosphate oxidase family protein [Brevinematales bacterium]|nr:pyridoxamine 5'-phosphate oxidase family protein [Brevinematales bacterium]
MILPNNAIEFLKSGNGISVVGTVSEFGIVNISPRFILEVEPTRLFFVSGFPNKTLYNLNKNPKLCISKWDNELKGNIKFLKIIGFAKNHTSGEIYEKFSKAIQSMGFPKPLAVTEVEFREYELYGG